jgi:uncharacterized membrane protein YphA (DoxX/SURF4 family)
MKLINQIITFFVGGLFVFSGLIKINDPVGMAIKLEEYFEVFANDKTQLNLAVFHDFWEFLVPFSLPIGVFLCVVEVVLGVALLVNYRKKLTLNLLLTIIVFFTFLTFYSAYFNKVTDCGCFGDAIKLTPWQSFEKDIVLTVLILILFFQRYQFTNLANTFNTSIVVLSAVICSFLAYYAVAHLPFIDFRPYKIGNNIPEKMKQPEPCVYNYVMEKGGQTLTLKDYPTDTTYQFKEMITVNPEACKAKITDYKVWNDEGDFTAETFKGSKLLIIIHDLDKNNYIGNTNLESYPKIVSLVGQLKGVTPIVITSSDSKAFEAFRHETQLAVPYYFADGVVLKTMIRSNPGLILLKEGTVKGQWHHNDIPTAEQLQL